MNGNSGPRTERRSEQAWSPWPTFGDRREAGRRLAERLLEYRPDRPVVLGLVRGGVPVAAEVARALDAPFDVLVVRKLGVPWHEELGFGAVAEGDVRVVDEEEVATLGIEPEPIERAIQDQAVEVQRRVRRYRGARPIRSVEGRTVILVDDGVATGGTMRAAIEAVRRAGAGRVVVGVPVASPTSVAELRTLVDDLVVVQAEEPFFAVAQFYDEFPQISDDEVVRILSELDGSRSPGSRDRVQRTCDVDVGTVRLEGDLAIPPDARGVVLFAHGSGSSRLSPRNRSVARVLDQAGFATLLFDLLTVDEEADRANVFDIELLAERLAGATAWLERQPELHRRPIGYFGASTGAAAALVAAAELGERIGAVVSRGGRPDLAEASLADVVSPTLLIVGGEDHEVIALNRQAFAELRCERGLEVIAGATHLFPEPGALDRVASLAAEWFFRHLATP